MCTRARVHVWESGTSSSELEFLQEKTLASYREQAPAGEGRKPLSPATGCVPSCQACNLVKENLPGGRGLAENTAGPPLHLCTCRPS